MFLFGDIANNCTVLDGPPDRRSFVTRYISI